jgi:glycosyltransferase involved in cell wall biosynthesis
MSEGTGKINVLFLIGQMAVGGSEGLVYNLASHLDKRFFSPSVAWFYGKKALKDFQELEIPLFQVSKKKRFDFSTMQKLSKIIKDNEIHIVNAHHFMPMVYSFYGSKIKNQCKLVYSEHAELEIEQLPWKWKIIGSYLLNRSDAAVGVSEKVAKSIQSQFKLPHSKIVTIKNGVDIEAITNYSINKISIRKRLGLLDTEKIIGSVANLKKIKNHIFLLKAFNELIKIYKNVKLLMIGESAPDGTEKELRDFVDEKGLKEKVLFLGCRADIPELLSIMDVFCLTSFKEGMPLSLIEAMAAGLPVIGTDVEGIRDLIVTDKNGFLVQLNNIKCLKDALHTLLINNSLRLRYGNESAILAADNYSIGRCIKEYQELFISLIKNK